MPEPNTPENFQHPQELSKKSLTPSEKISNFLEKTHSFESFDKWFINTPNEKLIRYLTLFNDIIRQQPINQKEIDGINVAIIDGNQQIEYLPPKYEDKTTLLNQTIDAIKHLSSPTDQGLLAYYAIQNIHPFNEGNGRTARLIFTIFNRSSKEDFSLKKMKDIIEHQKEAPNQNYEDFFEAMFMRSFMGEDYNNNQNLDKERENFSKKVLKPESVRSFVNQELCKFLFGENFLNHYHSISTTESPFTSLKIPTKTTTSLNEDQKNRLSLIIPESGSVLNFPTNALIWLKLINNHPEFNNYLIKNEPPSIEIDTNSLLSSNNLTDQHLLEIIDISNQIKRQSNTILIDFFVHPNQHTITKLNGQEVPIKDTFIKN